MQQGLVEGDPVVAGFDLAQHLALDLGKGHLEVVLLLGGDALGSERCFIQGEAEERLGGGQQCQQHPAGQVQHPPGADAIPGDGVGLAGFSGGLVAGGDQPGDRQPCRCPGPVQVVIPVGLQGPVTLFCSGHFRFRGWCRHRCRSWLSPCAVPLIGQGPRWPCP